MEDNFIDAKHVDKDVETCKDNHAPSNLGLLRSVTPICEDQHMDGGHLNTNLVEEFKPVLGQTTHWSEQSDENDDE